MILLAVAFGVSIVIAVAGIDISRQPAPELTYPLKLLLRALSSFLAASALAMLFNNSLRAGSEPVFWHWLQSVAADPDRFWDDAGPGGIFCRTGNRTCCIDRRVAFRRATRGPYRASGTYHGARHLCVRGNRLLESRIDARRSAGICNLQLRYRCIGNGIGDGTALFLPMMFVAPPRPSAPV